MIPKRIIPLFLIRGERLVKGTKFRNFLDVGDPLSQAMIYDAQGAEEIIAVDIEASRQQRSIKPEIIKKVITKCRLPITAGGGIRTFRDAKECFRAGADKVVINTYAFLNPPFVKKLVNEFGSQSIVVSVDVKKNSANDYDIYVFSGRKKINNDLITMLRRLQDYGIGEMLITSIEREGALSGFDIELYSNVRNLVSVPLIASGGAGKYDDMVDLFKKTDCDGCALGKMLFLRDYDIVRIKAYLRGQKILIREA